MYKRQVSSYIDGEALSRLDAVTANVVGYLQSATEHYFYTANVVLSNKILPIHWSIPDWKDWNILKDYLNGEASLLKSGTWLPLKAGEQVRMLFPIIYMKRDKLGTKFIQK